MSLTPLFAVALLMLGGGGACAQRLLVHNARGLTHDAMQVGTDGRVQAIGRLAALQQKAVDAQRIDAGGRMLSLGGVHRSLQLRDTADLAAARPQAACPTACRCK